MLDLRLSAHTVNPFKYRATAASLILALGCTAHLPAWAAPSGLDKRQEALSLKKETTRTQAESSAMDGEMFYQLLIAEIQAHSGDSGTAYQIYLELAKRHQSGQLYQRAVTIALQARAGEQALTAAKAWRQALPQSREACEYTTQILLALDRTADLATPVRAMIQLTASPQQPQVLLSLPRLMMRLSDKTAAAQVIDDATQPWRQQPLELPEAWIASSEAWILAKDTTRATESLKRAAALKPDHTMVGLLATDLMATTPEAERLVVSQLSRAPEAAPLVRLSYARRLASLQRLPESAQQLDQLVLTQPNQTAPWLTLGLVRYELKQYDAAEIALLKVLDLHGQSERANTKPAQPTLPTRSKDKVTPPPELGNSDDPSTPTDLADEADTAPAGPKSELEQANLLLSQIAEKQGRLDQAISWLQLADPLHNKMAVQNQRAHLLARQGKLEQARAAIRSVPEAEQQDGVNKIQIEAQLLREAHQLAEAQKVLNAGLERFPSEPDLMYDLAMICEKLKQFDRMETLLRKVIEANPDDPNAYNALGYSLADRNIRLDESRPLLEKALSLRPADPFITDSLAWLEYRSGKTEDAIKLLQQALAARPDAEIAAHLGEILWITGQQDDARKVFKDALSRDPGNDVVKSVLTRLRISL